MVMPAIAELLLDLLPASGRARDSTTPSGSGTSTRSSSFSSTASRAAAACSRRLPRESRVRTSSVSSATRVELGRRLGEVVVELGELLLLDAS